MSRYSVSFKKKDQASKVSLVSSFFLVLVGLSCIVAPHGIAQILPHVLGGAMVVSGAGSVIAGIRAHAIMTGDYSVGAGSVLCVMGALIFFQGSDAIGYIGVIWGVLGLFKAADNFDTMLQNIFDKKAFWLPLCSALFNLALSLLLILEPFESIDHHVIILGIELITYPFHVGKKTREDSPEVSVKP